jgi:hypothetical protein
MNHDKTNSWWLFDSKGIEVCRVCEECYDATIKQYNPSIFDGYDNIDETIEDDY